MIEDVGFLHRQSESLGYKTYRTFNRNLNKEISGVSQISSIGLRVVAVQDKLIV